MAYDDGPGTPPADSLKFSRPQGWRFAFAGINLKDVPDSLAPVKFSSAKNIRAISNQSVATRPGYVSLFSCGSDAITDLKSYAVLETDDLPRWLARDSANNIWLDDGTNPLTLAGAVEPGVSMIPFRPGQSPQAWMYIASSEDYQKISAPPCQTAKVGIAEPTGVCGAVPGNLNLHVFARPASGWLAGGTASGVAGSWRIYHDTTGEVIPDPLRATRQSLEVSSTERYDTGMNLSFLGLVHGIMTAVNDAIVQDVLAPVAPLVIQAIRYDSGSSGLCTIVPSQSSIGTQQEVLGALRRGALVRLNNGAVIETVLVLGRMTGPDGAVCFTTSTTATFSAGNAITGVTAVVVDCEELASAMEIWSYQVSFTATAGIGTVTYALSASPFSQPLGSGFPQEDEYLHFGILVDDPTRLNEVKLLFNVAPGSTSYNNEVYYCPIQPSELAEIPTNAQTVLQAVLDEQVQAAALGGTSLPYQTSAGYSQWTEFMIPISSLVRIGGDENRTLANCDGVQLLVNCSNTVVVRMAGFWIGGGGQPDVGADGAGYKYRVRPRSSVTGVKGNPSPAMTYEVRPRRQPVTVTLPSAAYDSQIDTWDIFRYGGSVTTYRYIGSAPSTATEFVDNFYDDTAGAGDLLETDNFEPWPSIDNPYKVSDASIQPAGNWIVLSGPTSWPANITRWLPGTLVQLGGQAAYTLRNRPVALSATSYLFEMEECVSPSVPPTYFWILEPRVARQILPYLWGPDATGTFFGVGDPLRPGTVCFSKAYQPDSAPDAYNLELCPPSEPLIGGDLVRGVSLVASTRRWWALNPAFQTSERYNVIEQTVGKGLVAPHAHCSDRERIWFVSDDGIYSTSGGLAQSLTEGDLGNIFPHEGVPGVNVDRNGVIYYAPDYGRAGDFRLSKVNTFLYFDYEDTSGIRHTLVHDLRNGGWLQDVYAHNITVHQGIEQQSGPLLTNSTAYPLGILADDSGEVYQQIEGVNDAGTPIHCLIATFEWTGDDLRMQPLFGDAYLDCVPVSGITVTPVSQGAGIATPTVIPPSTSRTFAVISIDGGELSKFVGLQIEWYE